MSKNDYDIPVVLLRCGPTAWDDAERLQGSTDLPLCDEGLTEVSACLDALVPEIDESPVGCIICSPDEASRATADALAERVGGKVKSSKDLRAMNLGVWEGLTEEQLHERFARVYKQWRDDPASVNPPEGESYADHERALLLSLSKGIEKCPPERGVAFVLRPFEYALAACLLGSRPTSELWTVLEDGPRHRVLGLRRGAVKAMLDARKAAAR